MRLQQRAKPGKGCFTPSRVHAAYLSQIRSGTRVCRSASGYLKRRRRASLDHLGAHRGRRSSIVRLSHLSFFLYCERDTPLTFFISETMGNMHYSVDNLLPAVGGKLSRRVRPIPPFRSWTGKTDGAVSPRKGTRGQGRPRLKQLDVSNCALHSAGMVDGPQI